MMLWISVESVVISLYRFVLHLCGYSLFFFINLASGLSILLIFSKKHVLDLLIFWRVFRVPISFSSALILVVSCLLLSFEFFWSYSCSSFNFDDRVFILMSPCFSYGHLLLYIFLYRLLGMCSRDSGMLCLHSCWFLRTSLFLLLFHCLSNQHSRSNCSVSMKLCGSESVSGF